MNKIQKYKEILHSLRLKQVELATKLNISRQRISDIFNGRSDFTEKQKIFLCQEYNINLNWLLADVGSMFLSAENKNDLDEKVEKKFKELLNKYGLK